MQPRIKALVGPLDTRGLGLEVAPYFNPAMQKKDYNLRYVDYVDNDELKAKAASYPSAEGKVVPEIDWVWIPGKRLRNCIPEEIVFDYALASHVVEHVPNTVGWLNEILEVMRDGAVLALAVPHWSYTMDFYRNVTTFGQLLANWIEAPAVPTPTQLADCLSNSFHDPRDANHNRVAWHAKQLTRPFSTVDRPYSDQDVLNFAAFSYNENRYIDTHCTVWTPDSFVENIQRIVDLGIMNVEITLNDDPSNGADEFIVHLTKLGSPTLHRDTVCRDRRLPVASPVQPSPAALPSGLAARLFRKLAFVASRRPA